MTLPDAHDGGMTNPRRATPEELADLFGVEDLDDIADDLYADYLDFEDRHPDNDQEGP
jgi:hypothetical protein